MCNREYLNYGVQCGSVKTIEYLYDNGIPLEYHHFQHCVYKGNIDLARIMIQDFGITVSDEERKQLVKYTKYSEMKVKEFLDEI